MRDLILDRIEEYLGIYGMAEQYAILRILNHEQAEEFLEHEDLLKMIRNGSDVEILEIYDIFSTDPAEMDVMYGVPEKYLRGGGDPDKNLDQLMKLMV